MSFFPFRGVMKPTTNILSSPSWYKSPATNRITGLWPGSTQHCIEAMRSPRWEDYEYTYGSGKKTNALAWLGNGWSENQMRARHEASYIYP